MRRTITFLTVSLMFLPLLAFAQKKLKVEIVVEIAGSDLLIDLGSI